MSRDEGWRGAKVTGGVEQRGASMGATAGSEGDGGVEQWRAAQQRRRIGVERRRTPKGGGGARVRNFESNERELGTENGERKAEEKERWG